ncbi:MAG: hypothetical protein DKM22_03930 [Candidatus Melainabacteria bacterium]|nr:MAG: hypothetical protein DKM22_03930 [Candidatus Melainabacteria bacterium]
MSYKNDSLLVIANKWGKANSEAKAQLWETYDQLRDITVSSASGSTGGGFEAAGGFLYNLASLFSPSSFMPNISGNTPYSIPGTSFYSSGATPSSSYGLETYSGFAAPIGCATGMAASIIDCYGSYGCPTGYASAIGSIADVASSTAYATGTASALSNFGKGFLMQTAGLISGIGGIAQSCAPYMGEYGLGALLAGNVMQGTGSAVLAAIESASGKVMSNADTILTTKVRNIETVCKMLDTQGEVVKKMLKEGIDSNSKAIQNM